MKNAFVFGFIFIFLVAVQVTLEVRDLNRNKENAERLETRYKIENGSVYYLAEYGEWVHYDRLPLIEPATSTSVKFNN